MPENFDILKYQFPPPGASLMEIAGPSGLYYAGGYRHSILWQRDIAEGQALVIASADVSITYVVSSVRGDAGQMIYLKNNARAYIYYAMDKKFMLDVAGNLPVFQVLLGAELNQSLNKKITISAPLPIFSDVSTDNANEGPPRLFNGPLVLGGPRTVGIGAWISVNAGAIDADICLMQGCAYGWTMSDPDKLWKDSFR